MIETNNTLKAWMVAALAAILAAALLALAVLAEPAQAARRTVTKTFGNPSAIQIPGGTTTFGPASPYPSEIAVGGLRRGNTLDVNLKLNNVSHTFPPDLDVLLVGPRGQNAIVMSDVGGLQPGVSNVNLTLDDEAPSPLLEATAPTSGRYQPTNVDDTSTDSFPAPAPTPSGGSELSVFDRTNPNGTWKLYVVDQWGGDIGEFAGGWALQIKANVRS